MQDAEDRVRVAQEQQRSADLRVVRLRAELEQGQATAKRDTKSAAERLSEARTHAQEAGEEAERVRADLHERTVQLSVLTDTLEALQVGTNSEREQRIVNLTAEIVASRVKEVALERRVARLIDAADKAKKEAADAQDARDTAAAERSAATAAEAAMRRQSESAAADVAELRRHARQAENAHAAVIEERDKAASLQAAAESEVAGLQEAMQRATARHFEQLATERASSRGQKQLDGGAAWGTAGAPAEPEYVARQRGQLAQVLKEVEDVDEERGAGLQLHRMYITGGVAPGARMLCARIRCSLTMVKKHTVPTVRHSARYASTSN